MSPFAPGRPRSVGPLPLYQPNPGSGGRGPRLRHKRLEVTGYSSKPQRLGEGCRSGRGPHATSSPRRRMRQCPSSDRRAGRRGAGARGRGGGWPSAGLVSPSDLNWTPFVGPRGVEFKVLSGLPLSLKNQAASCCFCLCCGYVGNAFALSKRSGISTALAAASILSMPARHTAIGIWLFIAW